MEIHVVQCRGKIHWPYTKISNSPSMPAPAKRLQLQAWTLQKWDRTPCSCGPYTISKQSAGHLKAPETFQNSQHAWGNEFAFLLVGFVCQRGQRTRGPKPPNPKRAKVTPRTHRHTRKRKANTESTQRTQNRRLHGSSRRRLSTLRKRPIRQQGLRARRRARRRIDGRPAREAPRPWKYDGAKHLYRKTV